MLGKCHYYAEQEKVQMIPTVSRWMTEFWMKNGSKDVSAHVHPSQETAQKEGRARIKIPEPTKAKFILCLN